ncbi:MAG: hypothetical protein M3Z04_12550 [Chloroflexota bacterium]|nr:hypothetical protein [Chloroflexota bacterium]
MKPKQIVLGLALLGALIGSALAGVSLSTAPQAAIRAAHAEECSDNSLPPPGVGPCYLAPTPTPTPVSQ